MKDFLKKLKLNEDLISNILGIVAILLVVYLLWGYFKNINQGQTSSTNTEATTSAQLKNLNQVSSEQLPTNYQIQAGDSLWKIAQQVYGSGYEWSKVYEANKEIISNPNVLEIGTEITLPQLNVEKTEYTVVAGDNLWNIAQTKCGDGYLWTRIATDNSLVNPRIIHPGDKLTLVCKL